MAIALRDLVINVSDFFGDAIIPDFVMKRTPDRIGHAGKL